MRLRGHAAHLRGATRDFAAALVVSLLIASAAPLSGSGAAVTVPSAHAADLFIGQLELIGPPEETFPLEELLQIQTPAARAAQAFGLALALAVLSAFNLTLVRHFRRVYASPRRTWRGNRCPPLQRN